MSSKIYIFWPIFKKFPWGAVFERLVGFGWKKARKCAGRSNAKVPSIAEGSKINQKCRYLAPKPQIFKNFLTASPEITYAMTQG